MSTTELGRSEILFTAEPAAAPPTSAWDTVRFILSPLASLRLTVTLLALSTFLVLAGTLAQVDYDILHVLTHYFRTWIAWIELRIFFPRDWGMSPAIVFPFFGGKIIGCGLALNLLAAHAVRFKMAANGVRLWLGWATILLGALVTYAVIVSGSGTTVEGAMSASFANGLWHALRAALGATALTLAYVLALSRATAKKSAAVWLWWFTAAVAVLLAALALYLFTHPAARLNASGLRILWQLAKATGASLVLGAGCWAVFSKRAGIVLLHSGVGLMMFTELYTAQNVVEARMTIDVGQTAYYADDIRSSELAFIDADAPKVDRTVVVPDSLLIDAARTGKPISHKDLPVDVRVVEYLPNATWRRVQPGEKSGATAGIGQLDLLEPAESASGVAVKQSAVLPAAYVELLSKKDGKSLGVYLTRSLMRGEPIAVDGKHYEIALRFKRIPKPYSVTLLNFKFDRYIGTNTAKNYESVVRFQAPAHDIDRTSSIWMNNPMRYGGDTLYQASFDEKTERTTVLQVMTNAGWMIPYVACMIVAAGMAVHFGQGIIRFVLRREDEANRQSAARGTAELPATKWMSLEVLIPLALVLLALGVTARFAMPAREADLDLHIQEFGRLPVAYGGRTQPMDSLARNTLRVVSGKATYIDSRYKKPQPAIRWLLDVVSQAPEYGNHPVIRIENLDVLRALRLEQRPGKWRYSLAEILADETDSGDSELKRQSLRASAVDEDKRDLTQRKFLEAFEKVNTVRQLRAAFDLPDVGEFGERLVQDQQALEATVAALNASPRTPRPVPPETPESQWLTIYESSYNLFREIAVSGREPTDGQQTQSLLRVLAAYRKDDPTAFNTALADYEKLVARTAAAENEHEMRLAETGARSNRKPAERLDLGRIAFESFYNHFDPFIICIVFYIVAFLLALLAVLTGHAWAGWSEGFNRSANWLLWVTFALHTFGLVARIAVSGRPPVTNLYSSAVFIGWACVLFGLLFEAIYKLGLGNLLAALIGVPTMFIAYQLTFDNDGDTLGVMQAVLDTNFWLGTHVVCIALGYSATLVAGGAGLLNLVLGHMTSAFNGNERRQLARMTYGALCFALFFSFIGTVLGGLWADDSWGRFWGWDPKENGALMIVLWNALVLHARWGKMVDERSFACLTVLGNIVVAWSWWGVNQLSIGLHNYGWTAGLTMWLVLFAASQIAVVAAAYLLPLFARNAIAPNIPLAKS